MDLCDIRNVRNIMAAFGLKPRKELGQNFLTDHSVVSAIADECCLGMSDTILEIGPGLGVLTSELAERYPSVIALELDEKLIPVLKYTLLDHSNVRVINADVMKTDLSELLREPFASGGVSVCANLPYYITSPILTMLLESELPFDCITVMVQKEVAERLCAAPGSRDSGAITLAVAYRGSAELLFTVPADRFLPAPKVDSAVVRIKLYREHPVNPKNEELMFSVIRTAFCQRRKTLANALSSGFPEIGKERLAGLITELGLSPDVRGERLDLSHYADLSDLILAEKNKDN